MKNSEKNSIILKARETEFTQESVREIQKQLAKQGYARKIIDYIELQNLHQEYGKDMSEEVFAIRILELSHWSYEEAKNRNTRIRILKSIGRYIINEMQEKLKQNGYIGKIIDYNELQNLHQNYGNNMDEEEFAKNVLLLSKKQYISIKDKQKRSKILKGLVEPKNLDFKPQEVREILKGMGYVNKLITYSELQELHREYGKEISEGSFAKRVLEISDSNYYKILSGKVNRIRILRLEEKNAEIDYDKIKTTLQENGFERNLITYERLQELHREYGKEMSEKKFALEVLEIHRDNYYAAKNTGTKITILSHRKETQFIKDTYLKDSRYYTKEEILKICEQSNISIDIFINRILSHHYNYSELYKELIEKGKVWIGKAKMSDEFVEDNFEKINKLARIALQDVKKKFAINYNLNDEDLMQEAIMCVINTRADIEKNFSENYKMLKMTLYTSMRKYIWFKTIEKTKVKFKTLSLNSPIYMGKNGNEITLEKGISSTNNTENEALAKIERENNNIDRNTESLAEKCIDELRKQIEAGKSREEALRNTSEKLNIGRQEMIKAMQNYLITRGMVKFRPKQGKLLEADEAR